MFRSLGVVACFSVIPEGWNKRVILLTHHMNEGQVKSAAAVSAASPPGICCESQVQKRVQALGFRV